MELRLFLHVICIGLCTTVTGGSNFGYGYGYPAGMSPRVFKPFYGKLGVVYPHLGKHGGLHKGIKPIYNTMYGRGLPARHIPLPYTGATYPGSNAVYGHPYRNSPYRIRRYERIYGDPYRTFRYERPYGAPIYGRVQRSPYTRYTYNGLDDSPYDMYRYGPWGFPYNMYRYDYMDEDENPYDIYRSGRVTVGLYGTHNDGRSMWSPYTGLDDVTVGYPYPGIGYPSYMGTGYPYMGPDYSYMGTDYLNNDGNRPVVYNERFYMDGVPVAGYNPYFDSRPWYNNGLDSSAILNRDGVADIGGDKIVTDRQVDKTVVVKDAGTNGDAVITVSQTNTSLLANVIDESKAAVNPEAFVDLHEKHLNMHHLHPDGIASDVPVDGNAITRSERVEITRTAGAGALGTDGLIVDVPVDVPTTVTRTTDVGVSSGVIGDVETAKVTNVRRVVADTSGGAVVGPTGPRSDFLGAEFFPKFETGFSRLAEPSGATSVAGFRELSVAGI